MYGGAGGFGLMPSACVTRGQATITTVVASSQRAARRWPRATSRLMARSVCGVISSVHDGQRIILHQPVHAHDQSGPHIGQSRSKLHVYSSEHASQGSGSMSQVSMSMLQLQSGQLGRDHAPRADAVGQLLHHRQRVGPRSASFGPERDEQLVGALRAEHLDRPVEDLLDLLARSGRDRRREGLGRQQLDAPRRSPPTCAGVSVGCCAR